jgi:rhamnulokinase
MNERVFAAVDVGASGGRVIAGVIDRETVRLDPVHRFPNGAREIDGHLRWNIAQLYEEVLTGLKRLREKYPQLESIGIDTWGVDYGLLDADGRLIAEPIAYRDGRTSDVIDGVHGIVSPEELFSISGLQFLPFNTIYQLTAEMHETLWARAAHIALLPDLIAYWLTGKLRTEYTNATTTGLIDVRTRDWSPALLGRLGISPEMLPSIEHPGTVRGHSDGVPVTTVASHDTASAVVGVPATTPRFAYVASGTWSLVGLELAEPVLTAEARAANFTNEGGVDGTTRFLRNAGGLWLLQESLREWGLNDAAQLMAEAASLSPGGPVVDVDDRAFIAPGKMPERIADAVERSGQRRSATPAETARCVIDSLAMAYARTTRQAADVAGTTVDIMHIVGGGSQNDLLCQLTADFSGLPVAAGPTEATALGNVLIQARAHGAMPASLESMRTCIARSVPVRRFEPR